MRLRNYFLIAGTLGLGSALGIYGKRLENQDLEKRTDAIERKWSEAEQIAAGEDGKLDFKELEALLRNVGIVNLPKITEKSRFEFEYSSALNEKSKVKVLIDARKVGETNEDYISRYLENHKNKKP